MGTGLRTDKSNALDRGGVIMSILDNTQPLWLPPGSVRAVLALAVVGAYFVGAVSTDIALLVLGVYFGQRGARQSQDARA